MSKKRDALGDRMKGYEYQSRFFLEKKKPVIIRIDGKAFHSFTRGMIRPFDSVLMDSMQKTMQYLCSKIQNCVFGYTQSDEITLVLVDYKYQNTDAWFGNNVQKMASVAASMATMAFNRFFSENVMDFINREGCEHSDYAMKLADKCYRAMFDARAFQVPRHEVINQLIWRQQDAVRNSIQAVGYCNFSEREMYKKNGLDIQNMLLEKGIDWNTYATDQKRGACCYRVAERKLIKNPVNPGEEIEVSRNVWYIDRETPEFVKNKEFVESRL